MKKNSLIFWVVAALPPLLALLYVHSFGVNALFMDEFAMVHLVTRDSLPDLSFLFARHNEHRIFFPRIVYYCIAKWTDMNSVAVMYGSCLLVGAFHCVLARHIRTMLGTSAACLLTLAVGLVLFHPVQWENILQGFQLSFYMTHIFALSAIFCFFQAERIAGGERRAGVWEYFAGAVLCAVVASFSSIQGLLAWPAVLLTWLAAGSRDKQGKWRAGLFCAFGMAAWLLYFYGFGKPAEQQDILFIAKHPLSFLKFLLALFGHPYRLNMYASPYAQGGIVLLLSCLVILHCAMTRDRTRPLFPAGFIVYGALAGLGIAAGRFGYTQMAASVSRYSTFTIVLLLGIMLHLFAPDRRKKLLFAPRLLAVFLVCALLWNMPAYLRYSGEVRQFRSLVKYTMQTYAKQPAGRLALLLPNPEKVRTRCDMLKKFRYNAFADPPVPFADRWKTPPSPLRQTTKVPARKDCLGMVTYIEAHESSLLASGWVMHSLETTRGPQEIVAIAQNNADAPAGPTRYYLAERRERMDLALNASAKQFLHAGFSLTLPADQQYKLGYFFDDTFYQCDNIPFPTQ